MHTAWCTYGGQRPTPRSQFSPFYRVGLGSSTEAISLGSKCLSSLSHPQGLHVRVDTLCACPILFLYTEL